MSRSPPNPDIASLYPGYNCLHHWDPEGHGAAMCFSATASFSAAAVIGSVGIVTLRSAVPKHDPCLLALAAFPLLFSLQQIVEGFRTFTEPDPAYPIRRAASLDRYERRARAESLRSGRSKPRRKARSRFWPTRTQR